MLDVNTSIVRQNGGAYIGSINKPTHGDNDPAAEEELHAAAFTTQWPQEQY